ncbi:MAG: efflux RND transporter periplasmic adaptor subunit [Polyangiaceae bacterium]|nr:efflux RND transporter periplasmic adaptor subunit [Polyangiaceae bacterium]
MEKTLSPPDSNLPDAGAAPPHPASRSRVVPIVIVAGAAVVLGAVALLMHRAESQVNKVAMASAPKPVTTVRAIDATYRTMHTYVGTLRPWVEANVGPQFVSAYVDTVLVRPGAVVKRNEVLATLDCRNASASSLAVAAEARAIDARQKAIADESARVQSLLDGGFVSPNEAEQKEAQSASEQAQLSAQKAKLASTTLAVDDCILRAPFDGEVSVRSIDPGAFVRPGTSVVTLVDRNTVRTTFDVPESDFEAVAPKSQVSIAILAAGNRAITGAIARRAPAADPDTRTVHVEVDLDNADRSIPVNTTGVVSIRVGQPRPASAVPLTAVSISGPDASLFIVENGIAHKRRFPVLGEEGSMAYLDPVLKPGSRVVTEGRSLLSEGDGVAATDAPPPAALSSGEPPAGAPPRKEGAPPRKEGAP